MDPTRKEGLERNLSLYTTYLVGRETYFWMPIFFLYFSSKLGLDEVLLLEAVYYGAVVLLEVPSGYASDRLGRRKTLLASSTLLLSSYLLFFWADGTWMLAVAQVLLAAGLAFASGTDTSFLYDTLHALGRDEEYGDREAALGRIGSWSMAVGALTGGALGLIGLEWAYFAAAVLALVSFGANVLMIEPERQSTDATPTDQLVAVWKKARDPHLSWLFAFAVAAVVINHIPYEFYQGYLAVALEELRYTESDYSSLVAGLHATVVATVAGIGAGVSVKWSRRLGRRAFLMMLATGQVVLVVAMGLFLHPIVAILLIGRGLASAMQRPPLREAIAPRVPSNLRATYFSMQSLSGRLAFAATLAFLALAEPTGGDLEWVSFSAKLMWSALIGGAALLSLAVWSLLHPRLTDDSDAPESP